MKIRLGTRGSMLALAQSQLVAQRLRAEGHDVELVRVVTEGDARPIDTTPGEGIFVTALASALKRREIDIAVHSAKDLPLGEPQELLIARFPTGRTRATHWSRGQATSPSPAYHQTRRLERTVPGVPDSCARRAATW